MLALSAQAERAIDYDEDDEAVDPAFGARLHAAGERIARVAGAAADRAAQGRRLVVVAGPPNSGKSSLINAIVGEERAIVTDVPGLLAIISKFRCRSEVFRSVLTDTAGLRETEDQVEAIGVERAERLIEAADVLVWLGRSR